MHILRKIIQNTGGSGATTVGPLVMDGRSSSIELFALSVKAESDLIDGSDRTLPTDVSGASVKVKIAKLVTASVVTPLSVICAEEISVPLTLLPENTPLL